MKLKYVYGPVPSRRLGSSLGVSPIPYKTCNYSCVYCQLGRTLNMTNTREEFFPREDILKEVDSAVKKEGDNIDYITLVGDGEPTLYKPIGWLIKRIKEEYNISVAVITNGSLLYLEDVREGLMEADVISPTLDAAREEIWKRINRPHRELNFKDVIEGQITFRNEYNGKIWIELMLVEGLNDTEQELSLLKELYKKAKPDRLYLNVPIRPPAEVWVKSPSPKRLAIAHAILGGIPIAEAEVGEFYSPDEDPAEGIVKILHRHPMREEQIINTLKNMEVKKPDEMLNELIRKGRIRGVEYQNKMFYIPSEARK